MHRGEEHGREAAQSRAVAGVGRGLAGQWPDAGAVLRTPRHFDGESVAVAGRLRPGAPSRRRGCRMVVDYDDALFHQYDAHPNPWVRRLLGRKIATVMRLAHTVVAGNAYLADYAHRARGGGDALEAGLYR